MWMNESEVKDALDRCARAPKQIKDAAQFLNDFCDLINSISDGWAYWGYGTKCSETLQDLVNKAKWPIGQYPSTAPSPLECKKACQKVLAFLRRCKQTKDNPTVIEFLNSHKEQAS